MKKHYLVDTNVVIDMLLDREDADAACAVFDGAERGDYYLHSCAELFRSRKSSDFSNNHKKY